MFLGVLLLGVLGTTHYIIQAYPHVLPKAWWRKDRKAFGLVSLSSYALLVF